MPPISPTRRDFLRALAAGAASAALPGSSMAANDDTGYRALVCLFLLGGNDAANLIVPTDAARYGAYAKARGDLALPRAALLPLDTVDARGGDAYGLHPAFADRAGVPGLVTLFDAGRAAFVVNTGPLDATLHAHAEQQRRWQSVSATASAGWGGALAARLAQRYPGCVQTWSTTPDCAFLRAPDVQTYTLQESSGVDDAASARSAAALRKVPRPRTTFAADNPLAQALRRVAQAIAQRDRRQARREVYFVSYGSFDTHADQQRTQPVLFGALAQALAAFHAATLELGVADDVTLFSQSEFGRTLAGNGSGSDHGWGGHQFVLGGAVRGARLYGTPGRGGNLFPSADLGGPDTLPRGIAIPTTSSDQYAATLARWMGLDDAGLDALFPSLHRYPRRDLGFLRA